MWFKMIKQELWIWLFNQYVQYNFKQMNSVLYVHGFINMWDVN